MSIPSVLVKNELSPRSGINISQVACKFIFDDGNNDDKSANTNIPPGGSYTLNSTNDGCCRQYVGLMQVKYPDGSTETLANSKTVEADYCGGQLTWHLVAGSATTEASPEGGKIPLEVVVELDQVAAPKLD